METSGYLAKLPNYPNFAFVDEEIDGLVPACRVESWEAFIEIMRRPEHNHAKKEVAYRGQRGFDWHLSSTLSRLYKNGAVPADHEQKLLSQFRLAMRGRGLDVSKLDERDVWAFGQHHGLKTPLIDWTKSPYVALFFAFSEPDPEGANNPSRAVFCLNMDAFRADDDLESQIFEPIHHENARLVNQAGLFTVTPSGADNVVAHILNNLIESELVNPDDPRSVSQYISKIHIPNERRAECLNALRKMNIHHGNLFPDPGGASQYCNDWLSRVIESEKEDEQAAKRAAEKERQKKFDALAIANTTSGIEEKIVTVLRETLTGSAHVKVDRLRQWAPKIKVLYEKETGVDWPERPSMIAHLKVAFRRFLLSNSVNKEMAEISARRLVSLFREEWARAQSNIKGAG